jgi:CMP-N-acetylneuraminic acid synthetase
MYKGHTYLAIVPARGGSNRLFKKNIRMMAGRPLIWYVADTIKQSGIFDRMIVSTDSEEIAEVAEECGLEAPFLRPADISDYKSSVKDALVHALKWVEENDKKYDYVLMLSPTTPMVQPHHLRSAADMVIGRDMVISVTEADYNSSNYSFELPDGSLKDLFTETYIDNIPKTKYCLNGAIYLAKWDVFRNRLHWYDTDVCAYRMDKADSIDINDKFDFEVTEYFIRKRYNTRTQRPVWRALRRVLYRCVHGRPAPPCFPCNG